MSKDCIYQREQLHINCPYCWTEFIHFKEVGGYFDYKDQLFSDAVILPFEHASSLPYTIPAESLGSYPFVESIRCEGCDREYTAVFLPWGLNGDIKRNLLETQKVPDPTDGFLKILQNKHESGQKKFKTRIFFIENLTLFFLCNLLLILTILASVFTKNFNFAASFGIFLLFEFFSLIFLKYCFTHLFRSYNFQDMPFLFHEKYVNSSHFEVLKLKFDFNEDLAQEHIQRVIQKIGIAFLSIFFIVYVYSVYFPVIASQETLTDILYHTAIQAGVLAFVLYFIVLITFYMVFFFQSLSFLMFITTKIPLKIEPWNEDQEFRKITVLLLQVIATIVIFFVCVPLILSLQKIIEVISSQGFSFDVFIESLLQMNYYYYLFEAGILLLFVIFTFYSLYSNITQRKLELIALIKKEIHSIQIQMDPSHHDIVKVPILIKKIERIEKIPLLTWIDKVYTVFLNLILPAIFLIADKLLSN